MQTKLGRDLASWRYYHVSEVDGSPSGCSQLLGVDCECTNDVSAYFWQTILCLPASRWRNRPHPPGQPANKRNAEVQIHVKSHSHSAAHVQQSVVRTCTAEPFVSKVKPDQKHVSASFGSGFMYMYVSYVCSNICVIIQHGRTLMWQKTPHTG